MLNKGKGGIEIFNVILKYGFVKQKGINKARAIFTEESIRSENQRLCSPTLITRIFWKAPTAC